jgi:hypothetical protein
MRRRILWFLAALNLLLALTLVGRLGRENRAMAQARRVSDYVMVPGEAAGGPNAVLYVVDTGNGLLGAMTYDDGQRILRTMPPIDLSRIFQQGPDMPQRGPAVAPGRGTGR